MRTPRTLRDPLLAFSLLTLMPTGARFPEGERTGVAGWFPLVGLALGGLVAGILALDSFALATAQPLLVAALVVALLAVLTRFLHWDGLADVADAWWGGATPARRLEIMSDSATGAFGATALVLTGVLQVAALAAILEAGLWAPLVAAPALGRAAATCAAWLGTPARTHGLGRSVMGRPNLASVGATIATIAVVLWLAWTVSGAGGILYVCIGLVLALVVPHVIAGRMGGVTGDVMGASVLVVETALYIVAAIGLGG